MDNSDRVPAHDKPLDPELDAAVQKYLRGDGADLEALRDKRLKGQLHVGEQASQQSAKTAAKYEKPIDPDLEASVQKYLREYHADLEALKDKKLKGLALDSREARRIRGAVALEDHIKNYRSSRYQYDTLLPDLGPYTLDITPSGRFMAIAGRKGHVAVVDLTSRRLLREMQVKETVRDAVFLHSETFFAVAQKKYAYIYKDGVELHRLREDGPVLRLQFLNNRFLLASLSKLEQLCYHDVTTGKMIVNIPTELGRAMQVNPYTGLLAVGHSGGTVTIWTPISAAPLVKMPCHPGPISALAFHPNGNLMATSGREKEIKIWDLRKLEVVHTITGCHAKTLAFSQEGMLAVGAGSYAQVFSDSSGSQNYTKYMGHPIEQGYQIRTVSFRPYEDDLVFGHSMGWSKILVPGSGETHFDPWIAKPFGTVREIREKIQALYDKLPKQEVEAEKEAVKEMELKKKTKGRNKMNKRVQKRNVMIEKAKKPFLEKQKQAEDGKKRKAGEETELPARKRICV